MNMKLPLCKYLLFFGLRLGFNLTYVMTPARVLKEEYAIYRCPDTSPGSVHVLDTPIPDTYTSDMVSESYREISSTKIIKAFFMTIQQH